jgi:predicted DNA-binding transcriptional regulator AlpA
VVLYLITLFHHKQESKMEDRYLSRDELAKFLGISTRSVDRRAADGILPPPALIGPANGRKTRRWRLSAVVAKLEKRKN